MFQFMRKSDKDRDREKKGGKSSAGNAPADGSKVSSFGKRVKDKLSPDDLHRLDEIRRSFKLGKAKKDKQKLPSGIIADYSENFMQPPPTSASTHLFRSPSGEGPGNGISHSDSSESSLSAASISLTAPVPPEVPAKPPRAPPSSTRSPPPPVPARASSSRYSSDYSNTDVLPQPVYSPSRPPTSASNSSFTPSFVTPPQSPHHNSVSVRKFYPEPELDLGDQALPSITMKKGFLRTTSVDRTSSGDFGFSVRKSSVTLQNGAQSTNLFVEPGPTSGVRSLDENFLLPGDRLVSIDGISVDSKSRDEVIGMIKNSKGPVTLNVLSALHWIESMEKIKSNLEEILPSTRNSNTVWLIHKTGFLYAHLIEKLDESGKCTVSIDHQRYEVSEDDIEHVNPSSLDLIPYLWDLNLINESSILHILRNRYHSNLPCTVVGSNSLIFLTKNVKLDLETQKLLRQMPHPFTHSKLLPNLYSVAYQSYRGMVILRRHQSILVHGSSKSRTKRECVRETLRFLSENKGFRPEKATNLPLNSVIVESFWDRLKALTNVVEFFCSASDIQNEKSTVMYNLEYDLGGRILGINSQIFLLDVERIYEAPYFGILQSLHDLSTCPVDLLGPYPLLKSLKKELKLTDSDTDASGNSIYSFFLSEMSSSVDPVDNLDQISNILAAMVTLGLGETFSKSVWSVFGAVYHLGYVVGWLGTISSTVLNSSHSSTKHIELAQQHFKSACSLLGLPLENVEKTLVMDDSEISRIRNVLGFSIGLYLEAVNSLFTTINKSNSVGFRNVQCLSINVVQIGASGIGSSARFADLSSNYMNDRLSKLLKEFNFDRLNKMYKTEGIQLDLKPPTTPGSLAINENDFLKENEFFINQYDSLPLLDSFPSSAQTTKTKGLLYFLDDAKEPARCLERFESEFYGENQYKNLYSVDFRNTSLTLAHSNGTQVVEYDIKKVLHHVDMMSASKFTNILIQESQKDNINCMFLKSSNSIIGICVTSAASDGGLRRASSIRRNYTPTWQKKSATINIKIQTDYLMDILGRTQILTVNCLDPCRIKLSEDLNMAALRRQIRSSNTPNLVRFYKSGLPHYMAQAEFVRRFKCLGSLSSNEEGFNMYDKICDIMDKQDLPSCDFKLGNSMVFMKPKLLHELESKQTIKLNGVFIALQSRCRGFLSRKRLDKIKIRDMAIRCVQKNVRKLLAVRDWSWWKLYQQISPLLKVQSSHEKLQSAQDELASLKLRYEKSESEKNRLKVENEKLEIRVNELSSELGEEQATSAATGEKLEQEMNDKQQIENQLSGIKSKCSSLEKEKQQLELDLAYSISDVNGDSTPDDLNEESVYKQRYERSKRELEMMKQRLRQREQDHVDQIMIMKKSLEKKCSDAWEESEEQKQIVAQLKRRIQKLSSEVSDVRCLHQEEASRCALLDKKQRRFDTELSTLNIQLEKEKAFKEKIIRERDAALIQKDYLFNEMQTLKMELQLKESKLSNLESEFEEVSMSGGSNEQLSSMRKAKNELQLKVKELEEELDDLAGQVQSLESTKLRLEMQIEQNRKEHKREVQQREEEIEDIRNSAHKKVKALECQLEAEHEERSAILRARQELERKVFDLEEFSMSQSASHEQISKLKKELKRSKALLKDAQTTMEQSKNDVLSKGMLRQLRHQLEDSESQRTRLSRAKQKVEEELSDAIHQIEDVSKRCHDAENEKNMVLRERSSWQMQFEEGEEQLAEVMKKYKASVEQLSLDQTTITEQCIQVSELEAATFSLKETIAELTAKLETLEGDQASQQIQKRYHLKIREIETRLELETTTRTRLEGQVSRLKEHIEKYQEDMKNFQTRELTALDKSKKSERQLRDCKEEISRLTLRESEAQGRRVNLEKQLESADLEISTLKNDLKLAMQRIEDLTTVIRECDETTDEEEDDSSTESICSNNDASILSDFELENNFKFRKTSENESVA